MIKDFIILAQLIIILFCITALFINRHKTDNLLSSLEKMIDTALNGKFTENSFDESRLSALETKFSQRKILNRKKTASKLLSPIYHIRQKHLLRTYFSTVNSF